MLKNLAIVGYGKWAALIEQLAPEAGFAVGLKLDIDTNVNQQGITPENFRGVDVAMSFRCRMSQWPISSASAQSAFPP